ncbi:ankyrin repeat-containing protein, putative [Ricinus communis]|uniref:Ankyrin repeat-containing protein, putative n=1 Tax=Ricinus communis TaxID=3988 RepID=B9S5U2_RICCO|nr:ankyrin repeat-containing protein, putative [Ricinus communis]
MASSEGYLDIVKEVLHANPDACSHLDQDGRIPLHLAAMRGRIDIMKELLRICPESMTQKQDHGKTILHFCVKITARDDEFVSASDDNGNTILHLSAIFRQVELQYLLLETSIRTNANALNKNGFTALDAIEHCPRDSKGLEIQIILLEAGVHYQYFKNFGKRLEEAGGKILVAATLTANKTFQAGMNPPEIANGKQNTN